MEDFGVCTRVHAVAGVEGTEAYVMENTFNDPALADAYGLAGTAAWNCLGQARASGLAPAARMNRPGGTPA